MSDSNLTSPWDDIAPDLLISNRKLSMIEIDDDLQLEQWGQSASSSAPQSGFEAFKHSMKFKQARHRNISTDTSIRIDRGEDSDGSLPDSPTRLAFDDADFFIENAKARNVISDTLPIVDSPRSSYALDFITSSVRAAFVSAKQEASVSEGDTVDWTYWGKLINDYDKQAAKHPRLLQKRLVQGIYEKIY